MHHPQFSNESRPAQSRDRWRYLAKAWWRQNIDTTSIREAFESFAGTERFNKFLAVFNSDTRSPKALRYWQSELWSAFLESYASVAPSVDDIPNLSSVFNICPLHRVELQAGTASVVNGLTPFEPSLTYARNSRFPFDNLFAYKNHSSANTALVPTSFCPACRNAYSEWIAQEDLSDTTISEAIELKGHIVAAFDVPFQASQKVIVGTRVLVQPPDASHFVTRISQLERSRDCFNNGSNGLKTMFAVFADVNSVDRIPIGTVLSFIDT